MTWADSIRDGHAGQRVGEKGRRSVGKHGHPMVENRLDVMTLRRVPDWATLCSARWRTDTATRGDAAPTAHMNMATNLDFKRQVREASW